MRLIKTTRKIGAGEVVEYFAKPVARAIDAVAGTKIAQCAGCEERKAKLNAAVPDILHPFKKEPK
jgi:hypothetical protein